LIDHKERRELRRFEKKRRLKVPTPIKLVEEFQTCGD
jgi:hypothetical protein